MRIQFVFVAGLALALMGQGCIGTPMSSSEESSISEETVVLPEGELTTDEQAATAPEPIPTPTPSPKPAPKPAPGPTGTVKPKTVTVEIKDGAFSPQIVAINAGDTVIWKNVGTNNHTTRGIRNGPLVWDSGTLAPGQSYSRTFAAAGRFGYGCSIHPAMTGEVIVGEAKASGQ